MNKVKLMEHSRNSYQDLQIANFLADYADGAASLDSLLAQHNLSYQQIDDLVDLTEKLRGVLVEVSPSPAFVDTLLMELVGSKDAQHLWWSRVQTMPNRMKIAAGIGGITLTAGMLLITARSLSFLLGLRHRGEAPQEIAA